MRLLREGTDARDPLDILFMERASGPISARSLAAEPLNTLALSRCKHIFLHYTSIRANVYLKYPTGGHEGYSFSTPNFLLAI